MALLAKLSTHMSSIPAAADGATSRPYPAGARDNGLVGVFTAGFRSEQSSFPSLLPGLAAMKYMSQGSFVPSWDKTTPTTRQWSQSMFVSKQT